MFDRLEAADSFGFSAEDTSVFGASRHNGAPSAIVRKVTEKPPLSATMARRRCRRVLGRAPSGSRKRPCTLRSRSSSAAKASWNNGRLIGQKRPLKPKEVWAIRVRLQLESRKRYLLLQRVDSNRI